MNANEYKRDAGRQWIRMCLRLFVMGMVGVSQAAPFVINSAGSRIVGAAIRSEADGTVFLTTSNGQTLTFPRGAYRTAFADQPSELAQVAALAKQRNFSEAACLLRRVKTRYRFLGWDRRAAMMLARVELALKNFDEAVAEYETLFAEQPKLRAVPAERARYMQALLGAGRTRDVATMIDEDIASGSRESAARAQVVRGDMKAAAGQYEEALLDYLRTVLLFKAQSGVLPEATYKTAVALKALNDPRAAQYFQKVISEFPDSEFADSVRKDGE